MSCAPLVSARLARPGTQIVSPLRHAAQPSSATSFGDMAIVAGTAFPSCEPRTIAVSVKPGQSAVAVTPVPRSSSESDSVSDRT